jgi:hypothetical protein
MLLLPVLWIFTLTLTETLVPLLSVKLMLHVPLLSGETVHVPSAPDDGGVTLATPSETQSSLSVTVPVPPLTANVWAVDVVKFSAVALAKSAAGLIVMLRGAAAVEALESVT